MIDGAEELEQFLDRSTQLFETALLNLLGAKYEGRGDPAEAMAGLATLLRQTLIIADLKARKRVVMEAANAERSGHFAMSADRTPISFGLPFTELIKDIITRTPEVVPEQYRNRGMEWVGQLYSVQHAFSMAKSISLKLNTRVQEKIGQIMQEGEHINKAAPEIQRIAAEELHDFTRSYAETVYETNISEAYNSARMAQAKDPDVAKVISALEVVGVADDDERVNHSYARGFIAAPDSPIWELRKVRPPYGFRCFLPGTLVSGKFEGGSKAFYSGPAIEINTRDGARLSITINHPILTPHGWLPAYSLREGDDLFSDHINIDAFDASQQSVSTPFSSRRAVHNQQMPAFIEDVFDAISSKAKCSVSSEWSPLNFHGDARWFKGDIHIIPADRLFLNDALQKPPQCAGDVIDMETPSTSSLTLDRFCFRTHDRFCIDPFRGGIPGGSALALQDHSVIAAPTSHLPLVLLSIGPAADWDAPLLKEVDNSAIVNAINLGQFTRATSGAIRLDKVRGVRRFEFTGHVYNLESKTGYIIANRVVTSNCRHGLLFVSKFSLERRGLTKPDEYGVYFYPRHFDKFEPDEGFHGGEF